ncbi:MAG: Hsp70 family protein, partial [Marmoricola sp.]
MVADAEQYAEEDRKRREAVDVRNQADGLVYNTEKFLGDNADKLPEEIKTEVQADVDELKKLLEDEATEADAFTAAISKLGESSQKMGTAMYANADAPAGEPGAQSGGEPGQTTGADDDGDVVDAEIVDEPAEGSADEPTEGERK